MLTHLNFGKGKVLPVEQALAIAYEKGDVEGWTYELLAALLAEQQDRGDRISTTTLTNKCDRSNWLKARNNYEDEPKKLWAAFRGTMFHGRLEVHAHPDNVAEARYYTQLPEGPLTGSPDLVEIKLGRLVDYKTNAANPTWKPWPAHVKQVQINRWLVDHAWSVEWCGEFFMLRPEVPAGAQVPAQYAGHVDHNWRENVERFVPKEWTELALIYMDDKGPALMPVVRKEQVMGKTTGRPKNANVADIWPDEEVETLVRATYADIKENYDKDTLPPIPEDFAKQQHPLCPYCPVRSLCWILAMEGK